MFRKPLSIVAMAITLMLFGGLAAFGESTDYPAPPVTSTEVLSVSSNSQPPIATQVDSGALASTGTGFDVGLTVLIAAAVVLVGLGLTFVGARRLRRH